MTKEEAMKALKKGHTLYSFDWDDNEFIVLEDGDIKDESNCKLTAYDLLLLFVNCNFYLKNE